MSKQRECEYDAPAFNIRASRPDPADVTMTN